MARKREVSLRLFVEQKALELRVERSVTRISAKFQEACSERYHGCMKPRASIVTCGPRSSRPVPASYLLTERTC
jgi:hypothetical protein